MDERRIAVHPLLTRDPSAPELEVVDRPATTFVAPPAGRHARWVTAVIVGVLAIAIIKPWGVPLAALAQLVPPAVKDLSGPTAVAPLPAPGAVLDGLCSDPPGWRVLSVQRWTGGSLRAWEPVNPVEADDPLDPHIPVIKLNSQGVRALGHCAPWVVVGDPPQRGVIEVWHVADHLAEPVSLQRATRDPETPLGSLFRPPGVGPMWPSGRYIFAIHARDGAGHWFGVDVHEQPLPALPER